MTVQEKESKLRQLKLQLNIQKNYIYVAEREVRHITLQIADTELNGALTFAKQYGFHPFDLDPEGSSVYLELPKIKSGVAIAPSAKDKSIIQVIESDDSLDSPIRSFTLKSIEELKKYLEEDLQLSIVMPQEVKS